MFVPSMEELRAGTDTHIGDREHLVLHGGVSRLGEGERTHVAQIAPHIIDIGSQGKPVHDIETESAIDLADVAFARVVLHEVVTRDGIA